MTPLRYFDVPEVLPVQVVPSGEVRRVPESPTVTNNTVEVVVVLSVVVVLLVLVVLDEVQDMEMKLKSRIETMMNRCFTWFPIIWFRKTQDIPELGLFYKNRVLIHFFLFLNTTQRDQPNQREPDPHSQRTGRGVQRGERVIWMDWRGELVVRVGFGD